MEQHRLPEPFLGQPFAKATVALRDVGDGLSEAVATDRLVLLPGEYVNVVVRARVDHHVLKPLVKDDPGGPLAVTYVLKGTERCTVVADNDATVQRLLDEQVQRTEQAAGRMRMVDSDGDLNPDAVMNAEAAQA
jgi:FtsP/CotA-like multicopper oxidase with cupredoxin domain